MHNQKVSATKSFFCTEKMDLGYVPMAGTENQGLHFAGEEQAQIVPLEVRCTGNPRVKETLQKFDESYCWWPQALSVQYNLLLQIAGDGTAKCSKEEGRLLCFC